MKIHYSKLLSLSALLITPWMFSSCATHKPAVAPAAPAYSDGANNTATAGLRSGDFAISQTSIDHLLKSPQPKNRPGLGTGWGNQVSSNVGYTSFTRASSKPKGVSSIYYNDKAVSYTHLTLPTTPYV